MPQQRGESQPAHRLARIQGPVARLSVRSQYGGSSRVDFEVLGPFFADSLRNRRPSVQSESYAEVERNTKCYVHGMVTLRSSCWDSRIVNPGPISAAP
ncbi:uncharacterized protein PADG_11092 [Paracoccidioides brasiliensis Pb18]|uniref:Uncharacterized protein n=1 Tax=Paracoccidioides brasiliensis (strain Pb18) TaxID=502780 RepID=A0A0A0HZ60_PARBD|nr:uncharacterized protein PADG_11092 [Paracoccidioides brasiliensis Pb18]KGM92640.1 hypothetical protein PADG_11092 [Paracoccidioides brasiliensis Pb18]